MRSVVMIWITQTVSRTSCDRNYVLRTVLFAKNPVSHMHFASADVHVELPEQCLHTDWPRWLDNVPCTQSWQCDQEIPPEYFPEIQYRQVALKSTDLYVPLVHTVHCVYQKIQIQNYTGTKKVWFVCLHMETSHQDNYHNYSGHSHC